MLLKMIIDGIVNWISNAINWVVNKIVFWQEWDMFSLYMLIGLVLLLILFVFLIKKQQNNQRTYERRIKW